MSGGPAGPPCRIPGRPGPGGVPAANQITLKPISNFTEKEDGFEFLADPSWSHQGTGPAFYEFGYFVFGSAIEDAAIGAGGLIDEGGSYHWVENLCLNGVFDATGLCIAGTYDFIEQLGGVGASESTKFAPVTFIDVQTELTLSGTKPESFESTSTLHEEFSQVPEPSSLVLLTTLLAGLGAISLSASRRSSG